MKKLICTVLCLSILLTGMVGITSAFADVPVIITTSTINVTPQISGNTITARVPGAPAKAGYYSCAIIKLTVRLRSASNNSTYTRSNTKSKNGDWGQGTGYVTVSVTRANVRDQILNAKADRTFQYYGIR